MRVWFMLRSVGSMVHFELCECGESFEVDTASRQVLCDECVKKNEDITILEQMEEI